MYGDAFKKFFWGFIFVLVGLRIKGFEILFPSVIGYIFIYQGLNILKNSNERFEKASRIIIPKIILSLILIYQPDTAGIVINWFWVSFFIISLLDGILHLMLIYNILMGIRDLASDNHKVEISQEAESLWRNLLVITILTLSIAFLTGLSGYFLTLGIILLIGVLGLLVATIVILVRLVKFMKKCERSFEEYEQN